MIMLKRLFYCRKLQSMYNINFPISRILPSSPLLILFSVIRVILEYKFLKVAN